MDGTSFVDELKNGPETEPEENVFGSIWAEYERVILHSLVTSFGLDFLVSDQHGGDVDTVHNVRKIGSDPDMKYKNSRNAVDYENRGEYDTKAYHSDKNYTETKRNAKEAFDSHGIKQDDAYVPGNTVIPRNNETIPKGHQGQLDHVVSAEKIHNDQGRVLAGLEGVDLANNPGNFRFTNAALNRNKSDMTAEEYIKWCKDNPEKVNYNGKVGEPLPDDVKKALTEEYKRARQEIDANIEQKYYKSAKFAKDTASAAAKRGVEMGLRQAVGCIFVEVWMCTKEDLKAVPPGSSFGEMLKTVGNGIKRGMESAKEKYKEIIAKFGEGFASGLLASVTTTICNIFFTTAKNIVRFIRQIYASVVQAAKVLFFNPDNQMLGDRIKTVIVILATGASVIIGTAVGDLIGKIPVLGSSKIGSFIQAFCSSLVSGLLSCTLLLFLDRSKFINQLVDRLNSIPSDANNYKEIADAMVALAAKMANIDIDQFRKDTERFSTIATDISVSEDDEQLNAILYTAYEDLGIKIPWEGDFDSFMGNKDNRLVFG